MIQFILFEIEYFCITNALVRTKLIKNNKVQLCFILEWQFRKRKL